jgi:hypothetical protein
MMQLPETEKWPDFIGRIWQAAKLEKKLLVIDRTDGESFVIDAGLIATRTDTVEFFDEHGIEISVAYAAIAGILLIEP